MKPYDWVYLCSDPRRLALTLRLLPNEPFDGLNRMVIGWCSHLDPVVRGDVLRQQADFYAPTWLKPHIEVVDLSPLACYLPAGLHRYWSNGKSRWSLGVKLVLINAMLTAPYQYRPYLYTDDDVIVPQDPAPLLAQGSFGSKGCFRFAGNKAYIAEQLFEAFMLDTNGYMNSWQRYDAHALDAGVWFDAHPDSEWHHRLRELAKLPYVQGLGTANLELRCLDQRFLTCYGMGRGWRQQTIGNGFAPPAAIKPSLLANKYFFHYKSQSKLKWMQLFEEYLSR